MSYLAFLSRIEDHGQELRRRVAEGKPGLIECAKMTNGRTGKTLCCTASARLNNYELWPAGTWTDEKTRDMEEVVVESVRALRQGGFKPGRGEGQGDSDFGLDSGTTMAT